MVSDDFLNGLHRASAQLREFKRIEQPWAFLDWFSDLEKQVARLEAVVELAPNSPRPARELRKHRAALTLALSQDRMGLGEWAEEIRRLSELVPAVAALEQLPLRQTETGAQIVDLDAWRSRREERRYLQAVGLRTDLPSPDGAA